MAKQSKDQQVKAVAEGLALGTVALEVAAVTSSKMYVEFAIGHALRNWSYAAKFPSLQRDRHLGPNYVWLGISKSERRQNVLGAWNKQGPWLVPYVLMEGWSVEEATEILGRYGPVPHTGWVELAQLFIDDLGDDKLVLGEDAPDGTVEGH